MASIAYSVGPPFEKLAVGTTSPNGLLDVRSDDPVSSVNETISLLLGGKPMIREMILVGVGLAAAAVGHASVLTPDSGNSLVLTVQSLDADSSVLAFDLRGTTSGTLTGGFQVYISDGQPLGAPAPPIPNSLMLFIDAGLTQGGLLTFGTPVVGGPGLLEPATFSGLFPITDPSFADFVSSPINFSWALVGTTPGDPGTTLSTWSMVDATSVPEPMSVVMVGCGLAAVGLVKRRSSRAQQL